MSLHEYFILYDNNKKIFVKTLSQLINTPNIGFTSSNSAKTVEAAVHHSQYTDSEYV